MIKYEFYTAALRWLKKNESLILPHSSITSYPWMERGITEQQYDDMVWNPAPEYKKVDPTASPKPTYATILRAGAIGSKKETVGNISANLSLECRRRITIAFGTTSIQKEIFKRISGEDTPEQRTERLRLLVIHTTLKTWLQDSSRTKTQLKRFDPTLDSHWQ